MAKYFRVFLNTGKVLPNIFFFKHHYNRMEEWKRNVIPLGFSILKIKKVPYTYWDELKRIPCYKLHFYNARYLLLQ